MGFPRRLLNPGERVIADIPPHWWYLAPAAGPVLISLIAAVGAAVVPSTPEALDVVVFALLAASLVALIVRYLSWRGIRLYVTTDRLIWRRGVLARTSREIPLTHLSYIGYRQSLWQRLLRAGDVVAESAGRDSQEVFSWLPRPEDIETEVYRQMGRSQGPAVSVADELERLDGLRRRGVLSEAEFASQKRKLLEQ